MFVHPSMWDKFNIYFLFIRIFFPYFKKQYIIHIKFALDTLQIIANFSSKKIQNLTKILVTTK